MDPCENEFDTLALFSSQKTKMLTTCFEFNATAKNYSLALWGRY